MRHPVAPALRIVETAPAVENGVLQVLQGGAIAVPPLVQQKLVEAYKPRHEED